MLRSNVTCRLYVRIKWFTITSHLACRIKPPPHSDQGCIVIAYNLLAACIRKTSMALANRTNY